MVTVNAKSEPTYVLKLTKAEADGLLKALNHIISRTDLVQGYLAEHMHLYEELGRALAAAGVRRLR